MNAQAADIDPEVTKLVTVLLRTLIYVVRWLARRYRLEHLVKF